MPIFMCRSCCWGPMVLPETAPVPGPSGVELQPVESAVRENGSKPLSSSDVDAPVGTSDRGRCPARGSCRFQTRGSTWQGPPEIRPGRRGCDDASGPVGAPFSVGRGGRPPRLNSKEPRKSAEPQGAPVRRAQSAQTLVRPEPPGFRIVPWARSLLKCRPWFGHHYVTC